MAAGGTFEQSMLEDFGQIEPFKPCAYYDKDGDCIEFFFSNERSYGKRLDSWVTVYRSRKTDEIVGGLLKGLHRLMRRYPGLDIEIKDGQVEVACILRAPAWAQGDPVSKKTYGDVIRQAEEIGLTAEFAGSP